MAIPCFNHSGVTISRIGLGCSRLGSMAGSSVEEADRLVMTAIERGIFLFDTASTYGQGDSERVLGRALRYHPELCVVTKIGKKVPLKARLIQPAKGIIRTLSRYSGKANSLVKNSRGGSLETCFEPKFLRMELTNSLRRLAIDCIPVVMLHSATSEVLRRGDAVQVLFDAQRTGDLKIVGVSVDDLSSAEASLQDDRITMIQVPFPEGDVQSRLWAAKAKAAGKIVIAREIFQSTKPRTLTPAVMRNSLAQALDNNQIDATLVGTTKTHHLVELLDVCSRIYGSMTYSAEPDRL